MELVETLKGRTLEEMELFASGLGHPSFRGRQLFLWINQKRETDFTKMTDLSKSFRADLVDKFSIPTLRVAEERISSDGSIKYLVELSDKNLIESVYIPSEYRNTLCVSTQVGCKMACTFCATGYMKFTRNLKSWEIVDQLFCLPQNQTVTNVVMMGMGEPFDNFDEMVKALKILQDPYGPKIGKRHITVSTVGLTSRLQEFVDLNLAKLAISLHGTTEEQRSLIMPITRKYSLADLMEACRKLRFKGQGRVTFEYLLLKGVNDADADANRLVALVKGLPCKINLLAYNEVSFNEFRRPDEERILKFQEILLKAGFTATYRRSRGRDVSGACGQLYAERRPSIS